jgi:CRP/FNR family transcriptional regulator, cyclic AMP receptor protein
MRECDFAAFASERGLDKTISLKPGEFLFREGDEADALYIVSRGTLRIASGSTIYQTVQKGGLVGEMALVDENTSRSACVIAGTLAELIRIDRAGFLALVAETPDFALMVMCVMARRLRVMNRRYRPQATSW